MNNAVSNKEGLLSLLELNRSSIKEFGVKQLGLFGSFVRNEQRAGSDIDFLVDFEPEQYKYRNFIKLAYYLEELLGRRVEIITRSGLSAHLGLIYIKGSRKCPTLT